MAFAMLLARPWAKRVYLGMALESLNPTWRREVSVVATFAHRQH